VDIRVLQKFGFKNMSRLVYEGAREVFFALLSTGILRRACRFHEGFKAMPSEVQATLYSAPDLGDVHTPDV